MKKLFSNRKAQLQAERKQVFQNFHDTVNESQSIISDMQKDVQILIELTNERRVKSDEFLEYLDKKIGKQNDEILECVDKLVEKQEGVSE